MGKAEQGKENIIREKAKESRAKFTKEGYSKVGKDRVLIGK